MASRSAVGSPVGTLGKQLRIVHIITDGYMMGGAQLNTFYSLRYQHREHSVQLILGTEGPLGDACRAEGISVALVPMMNRLLSPVRDVRSLVGLVRQLRKVAPDIVHTHSSKAGVLGRVAARFARVPIVVHTVHGPPFHDRQSAPVRWLVETIERILATRTDKIITVADAIGHDFVHRGICSPDRLRTVVSGIDVEGLLATPPDIRSLVRSEFRIPMEALVVTSIGRLSKGKNPDLLIDVAVAILCTRRDVYFLIVGTGEEQSALARRIDLEGLSEHVILCGPRDRVGEILAASDIFVQTSWREGISRSLVEAMYLSLPVVATDVVGTREVVLEGRNGYLVPPGDAHAMTRRITFLLDNAQQRSEMGREGCRLVAGKRSIEAMGEGLDRLYRELADQRLPVEEFARNAPS